jgi:hypothetical protein
MTAEPMTMNRRRVLALLAGGAGVCATWSTASAAPSAEEVLRDVHLSAADRRRVLDGEFVTADVAAVSERDLSFAIAFLVRTSPAVLAERVMAGDIVTADAQVQAWAELKGVGSLADFSRLEITSDEAQALSTAKAEGIFNFSAGEFAALSGARGSGQAVLQELRTLLLRRYQAYRTAGLSGIAPYQRGGGRVTDHGADLRKASEAITGLKTYLPALQTVLLGYPTATVAQMRETFFWDKSVIDGKATYVLTHQIAVPDGAAYALVRRQFYASASYNGEQAVAGFLPVPEGTVVVLVTHAFTDQVTGVGGSMKRTIGRSVMARKMREIFEAGRKRVGS